MKRIHEFDAALKAAFESGDNGGGVYFIQKDTSKRLIPCSPNKLLLSDVVSIRPGRRLVLSGFQTVPKTHGAKRLAELDQRVNEIIDSETEPVLIDVASAVDLLKLAYDNIVFDESGNDDREAHIAALEHLSKSSKNKNLNGKVWVVTATDRKVARYREEGRFSNAPDTKQQKDAARLRAQDIPVLMLLRQNGDEAKGWRGLPFWWPVIVTPAGGITAIFSNSQATGSAGGANGNVRSIDSDDGTS
jgi:hypothetical protein